MKYDLNNLPDRVKLTKGLSIYKSGDTLTLFYRYTKDAMYKFLGAIHGLSPQRIIDALNSGNAVEV